MKKSNQNLFAFLAIFTSVFCLQPFSQAQGTEIPIKDIIETSDGNEEATSCIEACDKQYDTCVQAAMAEITAALEAIRNQIRTQSYGHDSGLHGFIVEYMLLDELNFGDGKSAVGECGEAHSSCIASCGT